MKLESGAFSNGGGIPVRYTCEGADVSPELTWDGVPEGTRTLALVVDDPDAPDPRAPRMTWVHWVLYDIPAGARGLPAAVAPDALPAGTRNGRNDWKREGYGGPCPPIGRHRYFFRLYALDTALPGLKSPSRAELDEATQGHVLAEATLIGTYQKQRR